MSLSKIEYPKVRNIGIWFKTKEGDPVCVTNTMNYEYQCECKDLKGHIKEYNLLTDLNYIGQSKSGNYIDIIRDVEIGEMKRSDYCTFGYEHITKNIRSLSTWCDRDFYWDTQGYNWKEFPCYEYKYEELSDKKVKTIIMEDLIYGARPNLSGQSCVGTSAKGMDKDPNYRDGHYILNNNKEYTVTWCYGKIFCREGNDNGWYHNKEKEGRTIFEETLDWERYRDAYVKAFVRGRILQNGNGLDKKHPEIINAVYEQIKGWEKFKLSWEFEEDKGDVNDK